MYQAIRSDLNSVSASFSGVGITPSVALKELNQLSVNIFISFYFLSLLLWLALPHIQWKCETDKSFFETLVRNISICSTPFKLCSEIQNLYRFGAGVCVQQQIEWYPIALYCEKFIINVCSSLY